MKTLLKWLWQKIKIRAKRSWKNSKEIHTQALKKSENRWYLLIAVLIFILFSYGLLTDIPRLGLSFLFAGLMAIYAGYIYKGEKVMGYVLAGVVLATAIPALLPGISESYKNADYIGVIILMLFGLLIWYVSGQLKKGERPVFEERKAIKRRPRKRRR